MQDEVIGSSSRFSHIRNIAIVESLSNFFAGSAWSESRMPGLLISGNSFSPDFKWPPRPACLVQKGPQPHRERGPRAIWPTGGWHMTF
jgi:hypothetical protein